MATSPLFGWQEPDDTSLVKDGAAAIRTLGNAIDTSMGDLLGGTTGQVLAKASNTNMDFTWVAQDDSNAIQNAIVDAKGDLISASANDTPARLAVGNNGETIVADSSTATGLSYQPMTQAGKNVLINGAFDIWQRGTSFAATPANFAYMADRWFWIGATASVSQETTIVPATFRYAMKATATGTTQPVFGQTIETANCYQLAGKRVTLSSWVATSDSSAVTLRLEFSTSVDNASSGSWTTITSTAGSNSVSATSTMTRKSLSFDIPSNALSLRLTIYTSNNVSSGTTLTITGCQLELGSVATAFTRAGGTIQGELAACQRYYWLMGSGTSILGTGFYQSTTRFHQPVIFPTTMRIAPSLSATSGTNYYNFQTGGDDNFNSLTISIASTQSCYLFNNTEMSGTVGQAGTTLTNNASTSVAFSAEL